MKLQKAAGIGWKVIEKILITLAVALTGWVLVTVQTLDKKVESLESKQMQDAAQWNLLHEQNRRMEELTVEQLVTKRMFEMLLDQNRIKVDRVTTKDRDGIKKIEELLEKRKDDPERFRIQQMQIPNSFRPRPKEEK